MRAAGIVLGLRMITSEEGVHHGAAIMKLAGTEVLSGIVRDCLAGAYAGDGTRTAWLNGVADGPEGHFTVLRLAGDDLGVGREINGLLVRLGKREFQNVVHGESPV